MFPQKSRINKGLFDLVLKKGTPLYSDSMSLRSIKKDGSLNVSVVAEKKAAKISSLRNKLRRQGYYILKKHQKDIPKGHILIFFIKKNISFAELEQNILFLLSKLAISKK